MAARQRRSGRSISGRYRGKANPSYRAVEQTKVALSQSTHSRLTFRDGPVQIDVPVTRADFESWIAPERHTIAQAAERLLDRTGLDLEPLVSDVFAFEDCAAALEAARDTTAHAKVMLSPDGDRR